MMLKAYVAVKNLLDSQKGQGMVEYGLILALISIAAIAIMSPIGARIVQTFTGVRDALPTP